MAPSVLFIGGTGRISWWCVDAAIRKGFDVHVLNRGQNAMRPLPAAAKFIEGNAREPESLRRVTEGMTFDVVVNFVAYTAADVTVDLSLFRGRTGQYVFISSASAYQTPPARIPVVESTPLHNPIWAYSQNKIAAEDVLVQAYRAENYPITIVRPSHTYDHGSVPLIGQWTSVARMRAGKEVVVHGDGSSLWTLTHARDFVKGFTGLLANPRAYGESFHITSDESPPWDNIVKTIATAAGVEPRIVHVPSDAIAAVDRAWGDALLGDMAHSLVFDNSKIKRLVPEFLCTTTFAEGTREIIAAFDANPSWKVIDQAKDEAMDWLVEAYRPRPRASRTAPAVKEPVMTNTPMLRVDGTRFVDADGNTVLLRGYNIGGFLNMENFLSGYPSTESLQREALRRALGETRYELFFDRFYEAFFSDDDAAYLASLGMNHVRLPINYLHLEDDERPFQLKEEGFRRIDRVVEVCRRHGLYCILDLHAHPGAQNQHWHSNNPTHYAFFWQHPHFQDRTVNIWEKLATRYNGDGTVAGYNIMNEPGDTSGQKIKPFYDRVVAAVRAIDPDHIIFLDGNRYGTEFTAFEGAPLYENTVYAAHDYKTPGMSYGGPYPGVTRGVYVNRAHVEETFLKRTEFMRKTGTPIWIGEFGPVFNGDAELDAGKYQLLADQLDIYNAHGASWSIWAYKDLGNEGVVGVAAGSPWVERIKPVLEKKARLGVDSWGSSDSNVRDIMDPVERTMDREYPDFKPFPFGRQNWAQQLVRSIMLAEPMIGDFEACFRGIDSDEAVVALADSFSFRNCVKREPLADVIAAHTSTQGP